jgi:hypothetical protein
MVSATSMEPVSFFVPESAPLVAPPAHTHRVTIAA